MFKLVSYYCLILKLRVELFLIHIAFDDVN